VTSRKIIEHDHAPPRIEQRQTDMTADVSGATGHQRGMLHGPVNSPIVKAKRSRRLKVPIAPTNRTGSDITQFAAGQPPTNPPW
jgi:hypothetical protein